MKDLIPLQNSNAFQSGSGADRSDWIIRENETDKELFTLPKTISDQDMFAVRKFAKQYELEALNVGIQFQKKQQDFKSQERIANLEEALKDSISHSNKLAVKLATTLEKQGAILDGNGTTH